MPITVDDQGQDNRIDLPDDLAGQGTIVIRGRGNRLRIGPGCRFPRVQLEIRGSGCEIDIGERCILVGEFRCRADGTRLRIGAATTSMNLKVTLHEAGQVLIGEDCMFSGDVRMDCSDMHSILDAATGERLNPPADVVIGDHVWVGYGVYVMKGVHVGSHSVVGACSVVTHDVPAGSLVAGTPARVLRAGITWDRRCLPMAGGGRPADAAP